MNRLRGWLGDMLVLDMKVPEGSLPCFPNGLGFESMTRLELETPAGDVLDFTVHQEVRTVLRSKWRERPKAGAS